MTTFFIANNTQNALVCGTKKNSKQSKAGSLHKCYILLHITYINVERMLEKFYNNSICENGSKCIVTRIESLYVV